MVLGYVRNPEDLKLLEDYCKKKELLKAAKAYRKMCVEIDARRVVPSPWAKRRPGGGYTCYSWVTR